MNAAVEAAARAVCKAHRAWSVSRHSLERGAELRAQAALRTAVEQLGDAVGTARARRVRMALCGGCNVAFDAVYSRCPLCGDRPVSRSRGPISIRRTGANRWPWEVRCSQHPGERTYAIPEVGAAAINTRGIGNRTWRIALAVAHRHWVDQHTCKGCGGPEDRPGALLARWCPVHDREVGVG